MRCGFRTTYLNNFRCIEVRRKKRLLIADDNNSVIAAVRLILEGEFDIISASTKEYALAIFNERNIDLILLDIDFYGKPDGWEILEEVRKKDSEIVIFLMTGNLNHQKNELVKKVDGFFEKPFDVKLIRNLLKNKKLI